VCNLVAKDSEVVVSRNRVQFQRIHLEQSVGQSRSNPGKAHLCARNRESKYAQDIRLVLFRAGFALFVRNAEDRHGRVAANDLRKRILLNHSPVARNNRDELRGFRGISDHSTLHRIVQIGA
jgi:hypothetical protein